MLLFLYEVRMIAIWLKVELARRQQKGNIVPVEGPTSEQ
jgi:hypothetical protein